MKKVYSYLLPILLLMLPLLVFSQDNFKSLAHEAWNIGEAYEATGGASYGYIAEQYHEAGKNYHLEAETYTADANRRKYLTRAQKAYFKAQYYYDRDGYLNKAEAIGKELLKVENELKGVTYQNQSDKNDGQDPKEPAIPAPGKALGESIEFSARYGIFSVKPPASMGKLIPRRSETVMTITSVELSPEPLAIGLTETAFSLIPGMKSAEALPSAEDMCENGSNFLINGQEILQMMQKEGVDPGEMKEDLKKTKLGTKQEVINIGPAKACLVVMGGTSATEDYVMVMLRFIHHENLYSFALKGPSKWADILEKSARSFRIKPVEIPEGGIECLKGEEILREGLAIRSYLKLPPPKGEGKIRFSVSPVLPRTQVPLEGWRRILQGINTSLTIYQGAELYIRIKSPDKVESIRDLWNRESKVASDNWAVEFARDYTMEAILELGDVSALNYSRAIEGYLSVMETCIKGINSLESKITHMSANVEWEVPYLSITAECTPRMKCRDGRLIPDKDFVLSKEWKRDTLVERRQKEFLTPIQVNIEKERMKAFVEELLVNREKLEEKKEDGLCADAIDRIRTFSFWETSEQCLRIERRMIEAERKKEKWDQEKDEWEEQLEAFEAGKNQKIPLLQKNIKEWEARKEIVDAELDKVDKRMQLFKTNEKHMDKDEYDRRQLLNQRAYQKLFDESDFLEIQITKARKQIRYYEEVVFEREARDKISRLRDDIDDLRNEIRRLREKRKQLSCS